MRNVIEQTTTICCHTLTKETKKMASKKSKFTASTIKTPEPTDFIAPLDDRKNERREQLRG